MPLTVKYSAIVPTNSIVMVSFIKELKVILDKITVDVLLRMICFDLFKSFVSVFSCLKLFVINAK